MRSRLNRRTFLRGAGATVALPVLDAMLNDSGTALAGATSMPKRFLVALAGTSLGAYGDPVRNMLVPDRVGPDSALAARRLRRHQERDQRGLRAADPLGERERRNGPARRSQGRVPLGRAEP